VGSNLRKTHFLEKIMKKIGFKYLIVLATILMLFCVSTAWALYCHYCYFVPRFSAFCVPGAMIHCAACYSAGSYATPYAVVTSTVSPIVGECRMGGINCNKNFPCNATCTICFTTTVTVHAGMGVNECQ
jgi:hypothetical protein